MVARVPLREDALQRSSLKFDYLFVVNHDQAILIDRDWLAVHLETAIFSVHGLGPGDELCWIYHMRRATWVYDDSCIGKMLHQRTCAAGVIEVHVRQIHEVDLCRIDILSLQRVEQ